MELAQLAPMIHTFIKSMGTHELIEDARIIHVHVFYTDAHAHTSFTVHRFSTLDKMQDIVGRAFASCVYM